MSKLPFGLLIVALSSGWLSLLVNGQSDGFQFEDEFNNTIQYMNVGVLMASNLGAHLQFIGRKETSWN